MGGVYYANDKMSHLKETYTVNVVLNTCIIRNSLICFRLILQYGLSVGLLFAVAAFRQISDIYPRTLDLTNCSKHEKTRRFNTNQIR